MEGAENDEDKVGAGTGTGTGTAAAVTALVDRCSAFRSTLTMFPDLSIVVAGILDTAAAASIALMGVWTNGGAEEDG